jgi:hypothetical protein
VRCETGARRLLTTVGLGVSIDCVIAGVATGRSAVE